MNEEKSRGVRRGERARCARVVFMMVFLVLAVFPFFAGFTGTAHAQERLVLRGKDVDITCDAPLEPWARELLREYPGLRARVEKLTGWNLHARVGVFMTADTERFELMSGSPFVSAFAVPSKNAIAIRVASVTARPYFFNETFQHELCHLVLHEHITSVPLPKWLDEGICQWISGSVGEILGGAGRGAAGALELSRQAMPWRTLERSFPADEASLVLAYEESRSIVDHISTEYGRESLLEILDRMAKGENIETAVSNVLHLPLRLLEDEWLQKTRGKKVWLIWLGQYIYEVLFSIAALLTVFGFVRRTILKRRYGAEDDKDGDEDQEDGKDEEDSAAGEEDDAGGADGETGGDGSETGKEKR
jgi:hypothetical protein